MTAEGDSDMNPFEIRPYLRRAQYYETDQMGIIHHSNYVRWLEEARMDFLEQIGLSYAALEQSGVISPIVEVTCRYKGMVRFGDSVLIAVRVEKCGGFKLVLSYEITNAATGELCTRAETTSCFMNRDGTFLSLREAFPDVYEALKACAARKE